MSKSKKDDLRAMRDVVRAVGVDMVTMQRLLQNVGLHATAAQVNAASQKLGWEAAKLIERSERKATQTGD